MQPAVLVILMSAGLTWDWTSALVSGSRVKDQAWARKSRNLAWEVLLPGSEAQHFISHSHHMNGRRRIQSTASTSWRRHAFMSAQSGCSHAVHALYRLNHTQSDDQEKPEGMKTMERPHQTGLLQIGMERATLGLNGPGCKTSCPEPSTRL